MRSVGWIQENKTGGQTNREAYIDLENDSKAINIIKGGSTTTLLCLAGYAIIMFWYNNLSK